MQGVDKHDKGSRLFMWKFLVCLFVVFLSVANLKNMFAVHARLTIFFSFSKYTTLAPSLIIIFYIPGPNPKFPYLRLTEFGRHVLNFQLLGWTPFMDFQKERL